MEIRKQEPPEYGERVLYKELESNLAEKNPLINDIISVLDDHGFLDEDDKIWARLCLDEVIVNAIKHGNKECKDKKFFTGLYVTEKQWAVRVEDEGEGFSPDDVPDVEDEETLGYDHGRGILLMKNYMDEIWYFNNGASVQLMRYKRSKFRKLLEKILVFLKIKQELKMSQGTLKIEEEKNFTIVSFFDTVILDETNITTFAEELVSVIKSRQKINLVIDFANIEFLSSAVLGKLVKIRKIVKKQGGKLKLCGLRTNLMQIFKVTKLHKVFDIVADRKKAMQSGGFGLFG